MSIEVSDSSGFLASSMTLSTEETPDPDSFLKKRSTASEYRIEEIPLDALPDWRIDDRISHVSGRFFEIEGLSICTDFGPISRWCQPIINQPEIGILGILVKRINGVQHFLMQAKMEPGNSELVQYAATVQATPSNYERVHGGRSTPYLKYFLEHSGRRILFDQLLSEHASWYLRKRNRNMIVEIPENEDISVASDFTWLTLGQLRKQLEQGSRVNMNARTVLSGISYAADGDLDSDNDLQDSFRLQIVESHKVGRTDADISAAMTWLIDQKARFSLAVRRISLCDMGEWMLDAGSIRHRDDRSFRIVGLSIAATSREVDTWSQPMLEPKSGNVVALICQRRSGVLQFLVQAMVQPGLMDRLELAATVQMTMGNNISPGDFPPLAEYLDAPESWIRLRTVQSEDGGRFLRADTTHIVINVPDGHKVNAPENYRWMSLGLLNRLIRSGYYVNVEVRSLVACLL